MSKNISKLTLLAVLLYPPFASAFLGQKGVVPPATAGVKRGLVGAGQNESTLYKYVDSESGGRKIREYVTLDGVVFAVSWRGPTHPELSNLLGSYFNDYASLRALSARPQNRNSLTIQTSDITLLKRGHMGDLRGLAYVPQFMPSGVSAESLGL